jgi:hypothetical protein
MDQEINDIKSMNDETVEKCKNAFNQYLNCISLNKQPERCEKEFYEKCSVYLVEKWDTIKFVQTTLDIGNHSSPVSNN